MHHYYLGNRLLPNANMRNIDIDNKTLSFHLQAVSPLTLLLSFRVQVSQELVAEDDMITWAAISDSNCGGTALHTPCIATQ